MGNCCKNDKPSAQGPLAWFDQMIQNNLAYAEEARKQGRPVIGIMCEYTPREIIMAAGALPVCLCGGSAQTIGPAEEDLPANLCPLIKSTYGYHLQQSNPFLEMADLVVAETTCDGKKKMYELMGQTRDMIVLELPQKPDDEAGFAHWMSELHRLRSQLETRYDITITDEKLRAAIKTMNQERKLRRDLAGLMQADNPPLTGKTLLNLKSIISGNNADFEQYAQALTLLKTQEDSDNAAKVRVLLTGVPVPHGAERVVDLIEDNDGLIVCMENCTGLKPILTDVDESADDPLKAIAEKYYQLPCSVMTTNDRRLDLLRDLVKAYRPQCIIDLIWQACLTYDVESHRVQQLAEEDLGIPYLRISTDYAPSDSARIALRIEALFETVRSHA
jgi:benzoyl-CoA reductase/2-hydroxyglutaryl-CoA dehydratase subunit BcrC/BadD/HgdB